jgi:hypothetical protein
MQCDLYGINVKIISVKQKNLFFGVVILLLTISILLLITYTTSDTTLEDNSDTTLEEKPLDARCRLEHDAGPCKAGFPKYYFDPTRQKCIKFLWGGCDGVVPFETLEECQELCEV